MDQAVERATSVVETVYGKVAGADGDIRVFKGIPYAAPPVGALRWRPPQPHPGWAGVRQATEFGLDFVQTPNPTYRAPGMGEDCLTINVWTPARDATEKLPVLVWLYGGSYVRGSSSDPRADGESFARKGVVYVSFNYRAGLFGFLSHPALSAESEHGTSGNQGLLDAVAAFRWIRENIASFGGDPGRVTVFGVSAGAATISLLIASPLMAGLCDGAILQSPGAFRPLFGLDVAEEAGLKLGSDLAAMRAMTAEEVFARTPDFTPQVRGLTTPRILRPIRDGWVMPYDEKDAFATGAANTMPIIAGTMADEGSMFVKDWPFKTVDDYRGVVAENFGATTDDALALYPVEKESDIPAQLAFLFGDTQFTYGAWRLACEMRKRTPKTYRYLFTKSRGGTGKPPGHAGDYDYVFGRVADAPAGDATVDATDREVSRAIMDAWIRFAATGDPNGAGLPDWPSYDEATDRYLEFGETIAVGSGWRADQLDLLHRYLG